MSTSVQTQTSSGRVADASVGRATVTSETQSSVSDTPLPDARSLRFDTWLPPPAAVALVRRAARVLFPALAVGFPAATARGVDDSSGDSSGGGGDEVDVLDACTPAGGRWPADAFATTTGSAPSESARAGEITPATGGGNGEGDDDAWLMGDRAAGSCAGAMLARRAHSAPADAPASLPVTAITWDAAGSALAAAFGCAVHVGWCTRRGGVAVWRPVTRHSPTVAPTSPTAGDADGASVVAPVSPPAIQPATTLLLDWGCCVTALAFHPTRVGVLAAGTCAGEVLLWRLDADSARADGRGAANSGMHGVAAPPVAAPTPVILAPADDYLHRGPVCALAWAWDGARSRHVLASVTPDDGKVHIWDAEPGGGGGNGGGERGSGPPVRSFVLATATPTTTDGRGRGGGPDTGVDSPRVARRGGGTMAAATDATPLTPAVLAFGLRADGGGGPGADACVVGTRAGGVYRCATRDAGAAASEAASGAALAGRAGADRSRGGAAALPPGAVPGGETTLPWDVRAAVALARVPVADRAATARWVERYARSDAAAGDAGGGGAGTVSLATVYAARPPDTRALFLQPAPRPLEAHAAAVTSVAASPFHRHAVASAGADGRVCVRSLLARAPLLVLEPGAAAAAAASAVGVPPAVVAAQWSPARPCVLATACDGVGVALYDLFVSTAAPALTLRPAAEATTAGKTADGRTAAAHQRLSAAAAAAAAAWYNGDDESHAGADGNAALDATWDVGGTVAAERGSRGGEATHVHAGAGPQASPPAVRCLAFSAARPGLLAAGDAAGGVTVWRLGRRWTAPAPGEGDALAAFLATALEQDGEGVAAGGGDGGGDGDGALENGAARFLEAVQRKRAAALESRSA